MSGWQPVTTPATLGLLDKMENAVLLWANIEVGVRRSEMTLDVRRHLLLKKL